MSQKREYFRVKFPIAQRPCFIVGSLELEIIELSENGASVAVGSHSPLGDPGPFDAIIRFKDGNTANVTACVHRWEKDQAILRFPANLAYSIVMAQQRHLLQNFPRDTTS